VRILNRPGEIEKIGVLPNYCRIDSVFLEQRLESDNPTRYLACGYCLQVVSPNLFSVFPFPGKQRQRALSSEKK
jgi:hypothetical protein